MTRKVSGFLTKDGQYFPTKLEAELMEATTDFHTELKDMLNRAGISGMVEDFLVDKFREFVLINKEVVGRYTRLVKTIPEETQNDIRSVLLTTAPVAPTPSYEPSEEDDAFVSAFINPMGTDDGFGEDEGSLQEDRRDGEEEPSVPE